MNISFVSDSIYPYNKGGKEKRLYELSKRLAMMGHEVHIYTMHWWESPEKTRLEDGLRLHAISKYRDMYKGDRRSTKSSILFALACFKLWKTKFDVIDVDHMPYFPLFSMWLICSVRHRKMYGTWHEALTVKDWTDYMGKGGYLASLIEKLSVRLPYKIISSSAHTKSLLESVHGRKKGVALITPGIDIEFIKSIPPASVKCDVLYAGRLVKDKNVDELIRAIKLLVSDKPDIKCIIIGHGPEKARLAKLIDKLELSGHISLLDPLPEAKGVYAYMKATKTFCLASVREGFGMAALEALVCNTPVITIDSPANAATNLIEPSVNGSIVPLDGSKIAEAITYWLEKAPKLNMADQFTKYDWNTLAREQERVYSV
ncbi:MAG TPA: glycosyltransferase family 4 protein [Candidatus Saccharimonadales bacterium]|nr:glycosyltransferase family 4 protein [Candidatus Saccharimonadales bacterium]